MIMDVLSTIIQSIFVKFVVYGEIPIGIQVSYVLMRL
jgi:hypothetical protein